MGDKGSWPPCKRCSAESGVMMYIIHGKFRLDTGKNVLTIRLVKKRKRLLREAVESPPLEVF